MSAELTIDVTAIAIAVGGLAYLVGKQVVYLGAKKRQLEAELKSLRAEHADTAQKVKALEKQMKWVMASPYVKYQQTDQAGNPVEKF